MIIHSDYSYGIYLYAFPVQQLLLPFFQESDIGLYLAVTVACVAACAALSWHFVERRAIHAHLKPVFEYLRRSALV